MKIIFSNLGYARGISGSFYHHVTRLPRHFYQSPQQQQKVLREFRHIIERESPDLCCMVELDRGSLHSGYFNQIESLMCDTYCIHDIAGKYGSGESLMPFRSGKSNGFIARQDFAFTRHYFRYGTKRLIYQIDLAPGLALFFTHFSLKRKVRQKQFHEIRKLMERVRGNTIIMADFNILNGLDELKPLMEDQFLCLLNSPDVHTFTFHRWRYLLDLCLCSPAIKDFIKLRIIPQPFSDHAALVIEINR